MKLLPTLLVHIDEGDRTMWVSCKKKKGSTQSPGVNYKLPLRLLPGVQRLDGWIIGWLVAWMDGWMDEWTEKKSKGGKGWDDWASMRSETDTWRLKGKKKSRLGLVVWMCERETVADYDEDSLLLSLHHPSPLTCADKTWIAVLLRW